jgi:putative ABC transport system permease protein
VIVNQALAQGLWPGQDPIGKRLGSTVGEPNWSTVVGVVSDVRVATELRQPITRFRTYQPLGQTPLSRAQLVVRVRTGLPAAMTELREALRRMAPGLPPFDARPVRDSVEVGLANLGLLARILVGFAALGLILAALGIYGLFAGFVVQRRREIGVRLALGARTEQVLWLVLGRGLRLAVTGAAIGLAGALVVIRALTATATELPANDPPAIVVLTLVLLAVALFACWLPARRAAAVDPMVALRQE